MKQNVILKVFLLVGLMLYVNPLVSQVIKRDVKNLENYSDILKNRNAKVKMEVFDKNTRESTRTIDLEDVSIPANREVHIAYDTKITKVTPTKIPEKLTTKFPTSDFKVVPELFFGKVKGSNETVSYRIYFTSSKPFKYDHDVKEFNGGLEFVLVNALNEEMVSELEDPVYVEIKSSDIENISPNNLSIDHLSLPSLEVDLHEKDGLDSLQLKIVTASNLAGYETFVPIEPTLNLSVNETKIMGFGLEKTKLNINIVGASSIDPVEVSFPKGRVKPDKIQLSSNETKTVTLRSGNSLESLDIRAQGIGTNSQNYISNTVKVTYIFPWLFIIFSLIGGLLGYIARYQKKTKWKYIYLGMIDGLIAVIFYFVLKIPIKFLGELEFLGFVICGVAILGGLAGITRLFPSVKTLLTNENEE